MTRLAVPTISVASLLVALLPFACALLVSDHRHTARDSHDTLADIIDPDMSEKPTFDNNGSNFDIMAQLFRDSNLRRLLSRKTDFGMTLLIPNDLAANATAHDISSALDLPTPITEENAYDSIKTFIKQFKQSDAVLSAILRFHILTQEMTFDEMTGEISFETMTGEVLERVGLTFLAQPQQGIVASFPPASLLPAPPFRMEASNGYLYVVDRMIFPQMSQFTLSDRPVQGTDPDSSAVGAPDDSSVPPPSVLPTSTAAPSYISVPSASRSPASEAHSSEASAGAQISPSLIPTSAVGSDSNPECFPASAFVHLENGSNVRISQLNAGHTIRASESHSSMVYLFTHKIHTGVFDFVRIMSDANHVITLTKGHYLYANGILKAADTVNIGDTLRTLDGPALVKSISTVRDYGLFAPHTLHGDVVVNRVVTSSYTRTVHPVIAHVLLWPLRALVHIGITKEPLGVALYGGAAGLTQRRPQ